MHEVARAGSGVARGSLHRRSGAARGQLRGSGAGGPVVTRMQLCRSLWELRGWVSRERFRSWAWQLEQKSLVARSCTGVAGRLRSCWEAREWRGSLARTHAVGRVARGLVGSSGVARGNLPGRYGAARGQSHGSGAGGLAATRVQLTELRGGCWAAPEWRVAACTGGLGLREGSCTGVALAVWQLHARS